MPITNNFWSQTDHALENLHQQRNMDYQRMLDTYQRYPQAPQSYADTMRIGTWTTGSNGLGSGASEEKKNAVGVKVLNKIKAAAKTFTVTEAHAEKTISKADELKALGLDHIANIVEKKSNKVLREMGISAAGYKRINRSELEAFCKELEAVSDSSSKRRLLETPLKHYVGAGISEGDRVAEADLAVPPADVLEKLKVAREAKLFDDYAILHIKYVPDPILCGKIKESNDLYFIAEWGDDVKLSDIIKE